MFVSVLKSSHEGTGAGKSANLGFIQTQTPLPVVSLFVYLGRDLANSAVS